MKVVLSRRMSLSRFRSGSATARCRDRPGDRHREIEIFPRRRNFTSLMLLVLAWAARRRQQSEPLRQWPARILKLVQINGTEVRQRNNDTTWCQSRRAAGIQMVTPPMRLRLPRLGCSVLIQTKSAPTTITECVFLLSPHGHCANPAVSPSGTVPALQQKSTAQPSRPIKQTSFLLPCLRRQRCRTVSYFDNTPRSMR